MVIPKTVSSIGTRQVFASCGSLTNINVDVENPYFKSIDGVLYSYDESQLYQSPGGKVHVDGIYQIPASVTICNEYSFEKNNSLENITFAERSDNKILKFGEYAFRLCQNLKRINSDTDGRVVIPYYVVAFSNAPFYRCPKIASFEVKPTPPDITLSETKIINSYNNALYYCDLTDNTKMLRLLQYPIGNTSESYTIPNTVTMKYCFSGKQNHYLH